MTTPVFQLKTPQSYAIKLLAELLQNCFKEANFQIDEEGLKLKCFDDDKAPKGTMCIETHLEAINFPTYKFSSKIASFGLGVNLHFFYRILKKIKKRDTLILEIINQDILSVIVQQTSDGQMNPMRSTIRICHLQNKEIDCQFEYGKPIIATSKEFARIRQLHKIGDTIRVTFNKTWVCFFISKEDMITESVMFGEKDPDDDEEFQYDFIAENITQLVKVAGLSQTIQIYNDCSLDLPLKFQMNIGSLGKFAIFLKSKQQIELDRENNPSKKSELSEFSLDYA